MIQGSAELRVEKDLGDPLVQVLHFTEEKTEALGREHQLAE